MTAGNRAASAGAAASIPRSGMLAGHDDDQLVTPAVPVLVGHRLVQAAQQVLAVAGQRVPGVRAGDHQQVPGGSEGLGYLDRGVLGGAPARFVASISVSLP